VFTIKVSGAAAVNVKPASGSEVNLGAITVAVLADKPARSARGGCRPGGLRCFYFEQNTAFRCLLIHEGFDILLARAPVFPGYDKGTVLTDRKSND